MPQPDGEHDIARDDLVPALLSTAWSPCSAWLIAIVLGMALAMLMTQARWLERSICPYLVAMQAIPILAIVPIIGSIFGYETNSRDLRVRDDLASSRS